MTTTRNNCWASLFFFLLCPWASGDKLCVDIESDPTQVCEGNDFFLPRPTAECNNLLSPKQGSAQTKFSRYEQSKVPKNVRPSARWVSNVVGKSAQKRPSRMTSLSWVFGQFLIHDISLSKDETEDPFPIPVPEGDLFLLDQDQSETTTAVVDTKTKGRKEKKVEKQKDDPKKFKNKKEFKERVHEGAVAAEGSIPFFRSRRACPFLKKQKDSVEDQVNFISSYIDASVVYGSDSYTSNLLRTHLNGRMEVSENENDILMPLTEEGDFFVGGDVRANEHPGLTILHTIFLREHNRLADLLAPTFFGFSEKVCSEDCDEKTFQAARKIVTALLQKVTYEEYLPALIGENALPKYEGYKPDVDVSSNNDFDTAAFRFGHSQVNDAMLRLQSLNLQDASDKGPLSLFDAFFDISHLLQPGGLDDLMRGLIMQPAEPIDLTFAGTLQNNLFRQKDDLLARNIQRGRDHQLNTYLDCRRLFGLNDTLSFTDIAGGDIFTARRLATVYNDDVEAIDLFVGGLAEVPASRRVGASQLGELFTKMLVDQFRRLRDGDRFFYRIFEYPETAGQNGAFIESQRRWFQTYVEGVTFGDIIERNTNIQELGEKKWKNKNLFLL